MTILLTQFSTLEDMADKIIKYKKIKRKDSKKNSKTHRIYIYIYIYTLSRVRLGGWTLSGLVELSFLINIAIMIWCYRLFKYYQR